jgi:hypothetical protein
MNKRIFISSLIILAGVFFSFKLGPVSAQIMDKLSVSAIPLRLGDDGSLKGDPGETLQVTVRLKNENEYPLDFITQAYDYVIGPDGETPTAVNENVNPRWSLADWITVAPAENTLQPQEVADIQVVIQIPEDALPGGHYAMIAHRPNLGSNSPGETTGSSITQQSGTLLYLRVNGPTNEQAFVRGLTFPKFTEVGPVPFTLVVDNQSDNHITPQISVEIYNLLNQKVDTVQLDPKNVFPLMSRTFEAEWNKTWGSGFYKAKVIMSYGEQAQLAFTDGTFWLLPIKLIAAIIIGLLIILIIIIAIGKYSKHQRNQKTNRIKSLEQQLKELQSLKK